MEKWRLEHPHDTPPHPVAPSPTSAYSSTAIGALIRQVVDAFTVNLADIESGTFSCPLIEEVRSYPAMQEAHKAVVKRVFAWERTISAEIAGAQMITDVLERLVAAVTAPTSYKNEMLLKIVPRFDPDAATYKKILAVTDFVAGMTDTYLQRIHRRVSGHAIF